MEIEVNVAEVSREFGRPEMAKPKVSKRSPSKFPPGGQRKGRRNSGRLAKQPAAPGDGESGPGKDWKAELKRRLMAVDCKHFRLP